MFCVRIKSFNYEGFYNTVINTHGGSTNKRRKTKKVSRRLNGYFRNEALAIDRFGNSQYRSLFNTWFVADGGYKHGNINETISSVLGKNQIDETFTKFGMLITKIIDRMDENHCKESINENV